MRAVFVEQSLALPGAVIRKSCYLGDIQKKRDQQESREFTMGCHGCFEQDIWTLGFFNVIL